MRVCKNAFFLRSNAVFSWIFLGCFFVFQQGKAQTAESASLTAYQGALEQTVLLRNAEGVLPVGGLDVARIGLVRLGAGGTTGVFQYFLEKYTLIHSVQLPEEGNPAAVAGLLSGYHVLIFCLQDAATVESLRESELQALRATAAGQKKVLVVFDPQQTFTQVVAAAAPEALIVAPGSYYGQSLAAQLIFGGISTQARLRSDLSPEYPAGSGMDAPAATRLGYAPAELVGMNGQLLRDSIEAIIEQGRINRAYPGAQVLVAKDNKVIYHQAFGNHTYEQERPVQLDDLYDFASVTKITTGLPVLMQWYGQNRFNPDDPLVRYLPEVKGTNKENLSMRRILTHTAQLMAWIPFWRGTLKGQSRNPWQKHWNGSRDNDFKFKPRTFRPDSSAAYNVFVTDRLWLHRRYERVIYKSIYQSPLNEKPGYVYSDFFFYTMPKIVRYQTGVDFETYIKTQFYRPLGAHTLTLNPLRFFSPEQIVPTERDTFFRMQLLHGTVHDEGASMLGGVSGHAGLFGTANDLAKLMQMYLNFGAYGGQRFLEEKAVREFIRCQYCEEGVHRGLGFDKPLMKYNPAAASYSEKASALSFGHTGYTGTYTWADPEQNLLVIIFTNRVYPSRNSRQLFDLSIRRRIHESVYSAMQAQ